MKLTCGQNQALGPLVLEEAPPRAFVCFFLSYLTVVPNSPIPCPLVVRAEDSVRLKPDSGVGILPRRWSARHIVLPQGARPISISRAKLLRG